MDLLQLREQEIFLTLQRIAQYSFVLIGGYAVNAYTLPRFSTDCDIVLEHEDELHNIKKELGRFGYQKEKESTAVPYKGTFYRYEKEIEHGFKVSMDILVHTVLDRQTNATFDAGWIFAHSEKQVLRGKTITEELKIRVITIDALIAMKMLCCRNTDIRDIFMLMPKAKNISWIQNEVGNRYNFENRFLKIKEKITSAQFKSNLQGVYGFVDPVLFDKHKNAVLALQHGGQIRAK